MLRSKTLIVNLFGGPCSGKSTMAASLYSSLKRRGINCEMALEYAKDKVWEESFNVLGNQIFIFAKQHQRIYRLLNQTDVIICDSPLLFTPIYDIEQRESLRKLAVEEYNRCNNLNIFIRRGNNFETKGRMHNKEQSIHIDDEILKLLHELQLKFYKYNTDETDIQSICDLVHTTIEIL